MDDDGRTRCAWLGDDPQMRTYHDEEWGVPVRDDRTLFEYLVLDAFQAGLAWRTILHKRANFRRAFDGFDPARIARYDDADRERLRSDAGIVRNRAKIDATIHNARRFLDLREREGPFAGWLWAFVDGETVQNAWQELEEIPARTPLSDEVSAALKAEGFKFVGSTITYAFLQAAGLVNDHVTRCFRWKELGGGADG